MKKFNDSQISTIMNALADHARRQDAAAADFAGKDIPEGLEELEAGLRESAKEANELRAQFAGELHRRGRSSCDLAHPGRDCPNAKPATDPNFDNHSE